MDLEIKMEGKKKTPLYHCPKIKLGSSGDANNMWEKTTNCIKKAARELLGVSTGNFGGHRGDWWWNGEVQDKVEAKKVAYAMLV
ncbi:hypothetical protein KY284_026341 [Solanum tuberosum]|nr:hypothetical protein KY284_026341 [Solanum tuberosum]